MYKLALNSIKNLNLIEISINWKNTDFLDIDVAKPSYRWQPVNMTNEFIQFKIDFAEPLEISQGKQFDVLVLRINQRTYFRRRTDNEALN